MQFQVKNLRSKSYSVTIGNEIKMNFKSMPKSLRVSWGKTMIESFNG